MIVEVVCLVVMPLEKAFQVGAHRLHLGGEGGSVLEDPVLGEIAAAKGKSPAQIAIAWAVKRGTVPLVKTQRRERLPENINVFEDVELSEAEVARIDALNRNERYFDPVKWEHQRHMPYFQ